MKFKQPSFLLAVILTCTAPTFADKIPGDSKNESKVGDSAQALAETQGLHDLYAASDCGLSGVKGNAVLFATGSGTPMTHFSQSDKAWGLGGLFTSGANSANAPVKLVDFGSNHGNSSDKSTGKSHGKGNGHNQDGDSATPAVIAVSEPRTQLLLLVGLAGLGIFCLRRSSFQNAI